MPLNKEIFYIPNLISYSRFILLAICSYYLINKNYLGGVIFIVLIWFSDLLDGFLARRNNQITEIGKIVDPLADKLSVFVIVLILVFQHITPLWFVITIVLRDIIILCAGLYLKYKKNIVMQSNWVGKMAVFTIGATLFFFILISAAKSGNFGKNFYYNIEIAELLTKLMLLLSIVMSMLSLLSYFKRLTKEISIQ